MKKIIPLYEAPVTSYPSIANMLAMSWNKKDEIMPWLADHFVQLIIRPNYDTNVDYYDHAERSQYYRNLFGMSGFSWMRNNRDTIDAECFTDYVERLINNDYCIEPCLDRYYLSFTGNYQKDHFIHSSFIYGYDSDEKKIFIADFWDLGKYEKKEISYDEANQGYNNDAIINLYRYYQADYVFNPALLKASLSDYLNCCDSTGIFSYSTSWMDKDAMFGLAFYGYFKEHFVTEAYVDFIPFHILYDHKMFMKLRLDYIASLGNYDQAKVGNLIEQNDLIMQKTLELRNMVLKYSISRADKILERIQNRIDEIEALDRTFIEQFIEIL